MSDLVLKIDAIQRVARMIDPSRHKRRVLDGYDNISDLALTALDELADIDRDEPRATEEGMAIALETACNRLIAGDAPTSLVIYCTTLQRYAAYLKDYRREVGRGHVAPFQINPTEAMVQQHLVADRSVGGHLHAAAAQVATNTRNAVARAVRKVRGSGKAPR